MHAIALADGAGSAPEAALGAFAASDAMARLLARDFERLSTDPDESVKTTTLTVVRNRLDRAAQRRGCARTDLATTLLAVAASKDRFVAIHVGDGVIGVLRAEGSDVLSAPDNGSHVNETTFVTSARAQESMRLIRGSLEGVEGFILMSDGSAESLYDPRTHRLAGACAKLNRAIGHPEEHGLRAGAVHREVREVLATRIRGASRDDCSLAILARSDR